MISPTRLIGLILFPRRDTRSLEQRMNDRDLRALTSEAPALEHELGGAAALRERLAHQRRNRLRADADTARPERTRPGSAVR